MEEKTCHVGTNCFDHGLMIRNRMQAVVPAPLALAKVAFVVIDCGGLQSPLDKSR